MRVPIWRDAAGGDRGGDRRRGGRADAARLLANVLARLPEAAWRRTVLYTYPEPAERALSWVADHALHEVRHHRLDIERQE